MRRQGQGKVRVRCAWAIGLVAVALSTAHATEWILPAKDHLVLSAWTESLYPGYFGSESVYSTGKPQSWSIIGTHPRGQGAQLNAIVGSHLMDRDGGGCHDMTHVFKRFRRTLHGLTSTQGAPCWGGSGDPFWELDKTREESLYSCGIPEEEWMIQVRALKMPYDNAWEYLPAGQGWIGKGYVVEGWKYVDGSPGYQTIGACYNILWNTNY